MSTPLATYERQPGSFEHLGLTEGQLVLEGSCLLLAVQSGEEILLAFPQPGSLWDPVRRSVEVYGVSAQVGDQVRIGGGGFEEAEMEWQVPPPRDCSQDSGLLVERIIPPG